MNQKQKTIRSHQKVVTNGKNASYLEVFLTRNMTSNKAMNAFRKKKKILKSNKISLSTRIRAFNVYVASIFLYNSERWTLTKNKEKKIDTFQKNLNLEKDLYDLILHPQENLTELTQDRSVSRKRCKQTLR